MSKIFISYNHRDEKWKNRLMDHLKVAELEGYYEVWHDGDIKEGEDWFEEIKQAVEEAHVVIMLISARFLISEFIRNEEIPRILKRRENQGLSVIPLIIEPCNWKGVKWLAAMQVVPKYGKPLSGFNKHKIETQLAELSEKVCSLIKVVPQSPGEPRFASLAGKSDRKKIEHQHAEDRMVDLSKLKKDTEPEMIAATKSTPIETPKKSPKIYFITGGLILAVIIVLGGFFFFKGKQETRKPVIETAEIIETKWKNSIAVLPFVDMSPQKDQEYFCDGMTDDIITKLTRIGELKVISRTSVMRYKDTTKDIKVIGKELGVGSILEGSIRKERDNIRVTAQLINIQDGFHLWADTFDRKLESVFDVQDEVSKSIAEALQVELSQETLKSQKVNRPKSVEAYEYYLKGMHILESRYINYEREEDFQAAIKMIKKAIEIDPNYIAAYFGLGYAYELHWELMGRTKQDLDMLTNYAKKAYSLAPDSIYAIVCMAWVNFRRGSYDKAYQYFKEMQKVFPEILGSRIYHAVGYFLSSQGLYRHAIKYFSKEIELDPLYPLAHHWIGGCLAYLGEFEKAIVHYKKVLDIFPGDVYSMGQCTNFLIVMKKYYEAEEFLARAEKINPNYSLLPFWKALLTAAKGEKDKALSLYNKEDWEGLQIYSLLGMKQDATRILNKLEKNDYDFHYFILINNPFFDNLRDEPRFKEIVEKAKQVYEERVRKYGDL